MTSDSRDERQPAPPGLRSGRIWPAACGRLGWTTLPLGAVLLVLGAALVPSGQAAAYVLNAVQLDNGTCGQHLQIGSDKTASSVDTPSFLLNGDGGLASYQVSIDSTVIGTFSSNQDGQVCIDDTTPLTEGPHQLTGEELAPNPAHGVPPFNFTVDTVPLASPSQPTLDPDSDSGTPGDDTTNVTSPRLDGTSVPDVPIRILEGSRLVGGAMSDSTGAWTAITDPLAAGVNDLTAATVNEAGVQSPPSPVLVLTIITTPPPAPPPPTLDPASGSGDVSTTPDPVIDGAGAASGDTVTVFVDGTTDGTTTSDGSGNWQVTLPDLADGSYTVTATVTDAAGNISAPSNALALTVSSASVPDAPVVTATPGNGSVSLTWSVPADGGSVITAYVVYRGTAPGAETLLGSVTTTSDTDLSVVNGTSYYYEVSAVNGVGPGPLSTEVAATPSAPGQAPTITSPGSLTVTIRHTFSFRVVATGSPSPTFSASGTLPRGVSFDAVTGVLSGTPRARSAGMYTLEVSATNAAGTTEQNLSVRTNKAP